MDIEDMGFFTIIGSVWLIFFLFLSLCGLAAVAVLEVASMVSESWEKF